MGELYAIAQRHMDAYGVRAAALARLMGVPSQTLGAWKTRGVRALPAKEHLEALAVQTRTPYGEVLQAALRDAGYLPKQVMGNAQHPAPIAITEADATTVMTDRALPTAGAQPHDDDSPETDRPG